ncbi:MAG: YitT family protein [Acholeplasma sp.]|nr:YitT family protein [Acholeplasma sp.]
MLKNRKIKEILEITLGVFLVTVAFYFFYSPLNLVTGGVTGLSILVKDLFNLSGVYTSIFIFSANVILLIVGGALLGKEFFLKTIYGTLLLPALTFILSVLKVPTDLLIREISPTGNSLLIAAITGSVITGLGLGLVFKNNATTGGTDVIQKVLYNKTKVPYSFAIYITDGLIILLGLFVFGIEETFYAVLALIIAGLVVDKIILTGRSGYTVFIITNHYQELKEAIYNKVNRGITKISVVGGFSDTERDMVVCTITRNQLYSLKSVVAEIDPKAFTFITKTTESVGEGFN